MWYCSYDMQDTDLINILQCSVKYAFLFFNLFNPIYDSFGNGVRSSILECLQNDTSIILYGSVWTTESLKSAPQ